MRTGPVNNVREVFTWPRYVTRCYQPHGAYDNLHYQQRLSLENLLGLRQWMAFSHTTLLSSEIFSTKAAASGSGWLFVAHAPEGWLRTPVSARGLARRMEVPAAFGESKGEGGRLKIGDGGQGPSISQHFSVSAFPVSVALKVLHVLSGLGQGGIEKWLVNLTAELQRQHGNEVQCEFLTLLSSGGYYESTLKSMGCRVHHCQLVWRNLPGFIFRLGSLLRRGRYDVVHCHADYLSGLILPVAHAVGVRTRICHVHNTQFAFQARRPLARHLIGRLLRRSSIWDGGYCVGTSRAAIDAYLGRLRNRMCNRVCVCGIPCVDYRQAVNREKAAIRHSLNWPEGSKVILHVGRHSEQKNLFFLLDIIAGALRRDPKLLCVLAGSGILTGALQEMASELGISQSVQFLGSRDDVPQLMRGADLFLLPSLFEGLGLVVIEAQAVGLRSLVSDVVPPEVELVDGLVHRLALREPAEVWSARVWKLLGQPEPEPQACLRVVEASPFNIEYSAKSLMALYSAPA